MPCKQLSFVVCLATAFSVHAAEVDWSKLPAPAKKSGVTFEKDIRPLFEASCVRCHGPERAKGDLRLDSLEAILKGSEHGKILKPGDSKASKVVMAISQLDPEMTMPPKPDEGQRPRGNRPGRRPGAQAGATAGAPAQPPRPQGPPPKPLTAEEVGLVRAWIDQGAK